MSSISGSCSDSATQVLFEKGLQQVQEQRQLEEKQALKTQAADNSAESVLLQSAGIEKSAEARSTEGLKGSLFDDFA